MPEKNAKKNSAAKKPSQKKKEKRLTLDDVVVALQKSFSRVSGRSAEVPRESPRAMVTGQVSFEISLKVDPDEDFLYLNANGAIDMRLSGVIDTDVRTVDEEEVI